MVWPAKVGEALAARLGGLWGDDYVIVSNLGSYSCLPLGLFTGLVTDLPQARMGQAGVATLPRRRKFSPPTG